MRTPIGPNSLQSLWSLRKTLGPLELGISADSGSKTARTSVAVALAALLLGSCAASDGFPDRPVSSGDDLDLLVNQFFGEGFDADYKNAGANEAAKRQARNEIINGRLAAFDILFNRYQNELHREGVGVNLGSDAILVGLGAAGAVVTGGASQILSAAAGGVTGFKGAIDRDVFFEKTLPVLLQEMNAQRKGVLVEIRRGQRDTTANYPLSQGLADLEAYYFAGTIPGALVGITESAGEKGAEAATILGEISSEAVDPEVLGGAAQNIIDIQSLTDPQALRLVLVIENMFPNEIQPFTSQLDPGGLRFTDPNIARQLIRNATPRLNRTRAGVSRLRQAIETVKQ